MKKGSTTRTTYTSRGVKPVADAEQRVPARNQALAER